MNAQRKGSANLAPRRRARRARTAKRYASVAAVIVALAIASRFTGRRIFREPLRTDVNYRITRIFDGDTIELDGEHRVRLIGVDTPEAWPSDKLERDAARSGTPVEEVLALGREASEFTKRLCDGRMARVAFDPLFAPRKHRDIYGRWLAYVYLVHPVDPGAEPIFLNRVLVEEGYARRSGFEFSLRDEFRDLEAEARANEAGLWKHGPIP